MSSQNDPKWKNFADIGEMSGGCQGASKVHEIARLPIENYPRESSLAQKTKSKISNAQKLCHRIETLHKLTIIYNFQGDNKISSKTFNHNCQSQLTVAFTFTLL